MTRDEELEKRAFYASDDDTESLVRELIEARRLLREALERLPYRGVENDIEARIRAFLDGETKTDD